MNSDATLIAGAVVKHGRDDRSFVLVDPIANGRQGLRELSDVPINSGGRSSHPPTSKTKKQKRKEKKGKRRRRAIENKSTGRERWKVGEAKRLVFTIDCLSRLIQFQSGFRCSGIIYLSKFHSS